jgi:glycosyltransferase involved in cell wall biosynthesis
LPCIIAKDGNRDGLPTVMLEAMAAGLPVVATTVTGNPEIVDDGVNGLLVPPEDVPALAEALARLLQDETLRREMGAAARSKVEQCFDVRRNVAQLRQWLAEPVAPAPEPEPLAYAIPLELLLPAMPVVPRLEEVLA